jgi:hypothetical protein
LLDQLVTADPIAMPDQNYATLEAEGMLRGGDEQRHGSLESYLAQRLSELPVELEEPGSPASASPDDGVRRPLRLPGRVPAV